MSRFFACVLGVMVALVAACGSDAPAASSEPSAPAPAADEIAPTFSDDAALSASAPGGLDETPRAVSLRWPAASDAVGVARYELRLDGEAVKQVEGDVVEATLDAVTFERARSFAVVAVDAAGNASAPLVTDDALAPFFVGRATVESEAGGPTLRWPEARDDVGVVEYLVQRGEEVLARVVPTEPRSHLLGGEIGEGGVVVVARDAVGHTTALTPLVAARAEPMDASRLRQQNRQILDVLEASAQTRGTAGFLDRPSGSVRGLLEAAEVDSTRRDEAESEGAGSLRVRSGVPAR